MGWKPEYQANREAREAADPELRAKRLKSAADSQQRNREYRKTYMKDYRAANPEKWAGTPEKLAKKNEARRKRYAEDQAYRDMHKALVKAYQESNPDIRKQQRIKKYGLTLAQFNAMLAEQSGKCDICGHSDLSAPNNFPLVDHCHSTGRCGA